MNASVILVLVGLPGAGKTTFSKLCEQHLLDLTTTVFHYDELCTTFAGDERKSVLRRVESFVVAAKKSLGTKHVIIIDDNNYYKSMRAEYLKLCKRLSLGFLVVHINVSLETAIDRNDCRCRSAQVSYDKIVEMACKLEAPSGDHVIYVDEHVRLDSEYFAGLKVKIFEAAKRVLPLVHTEKMRVEQSQLQKVDLALRQIVHKKILKDKSRARDLNEFKKDLYSKICAKQISLSVFDGQGAVTNVGDDDLLVEELEKHFE